ncbi:MAG: hypothetical protein ACRDHH_04575 [Actinomycetota bacterium]
MARAAVLALTLALGSCAGPGDPAAESAGSGIRGRVVILPTCPVETVASPCPPKPVATTVGVESEDGDLRRVETEPDGTFRVGLPPGSYLVSAKPPPGTFIVPVTQPVTVEAGGYGQVTVVLDSRLREPAS